MRIAIGELKQESNTFATVPTTLDHFRDFHLWYGDDLIANLEGTNTEIAGFLDVCGEWGYEVLPTLAAFAISGAPLTTETFATLRDDLLARLEAQMPFDAVLLALHGAMVAEDESDPDGSVLAAVRRLIGPRTPLVVTMDLHANVTRRCIENADALVGFKTSPHVDQRRTGAHAARILARWLAGEIRPAMAYAKIPMVTPASAHVHFLDGPFQRLQDAARQMEEEGALAASAFTVQPWLDIPEMGFATVVVTDDDPALAQEMACRLADQAWAERHAFLDVELVPPREAIERALQRPAGPVVLSDLADGTGAGSPGDSTAVIEALLVAEPSKPALVWIFDPEAAAAAAEAGVGGTVDLYAGGKRDAIYNRPVRFTGTVEAVRPAAYRFGGEGYTGIEMDMGLSAVLCHGQIYLLATSKSVMTVDPALYRAMGLEPAEAQIVVVKSHIQFRAGYADLAQEMILLDTPGMSSDHLTSLDFRRVDRPLFPFDPDFDYHCSADQREAFTAKSGETTDGHR